MSETMPVLDAAATEALRATQADRAARYARQGIDEPDARPGGRTLQGLRGFETDESFERRLAALPAVVVAKLELLDEQAEAARAAAAAVASRARDARAGRQRIEAALAEATTQREHRARRVRGIAGPAPERDAPRYTDTDVPALTSQLERATADATRLAERHEAVAETARTATALAERCLRWLRDTSADDLRIMVAKAAKAVGGQGANAAPERIGAQLATTRAEIARLEGERATIEAAGVPLEQAVARMSTFIDEQAAKWEADASVFLERACPVPGSEDGYRYATVVPIAAERFAAFALAFMGDALKARLAAQLEAAAAERGLLLADAERDKRLAALDAELLGLAMTEEMLVCRSEAAGQAVPRRATAMPAAVLAVAP